MIEDAPRPIHPDRPLHAAARDALAWLGVMPRRRAVIAGRRVSYYSKRELLRIYEDVFVTQDYQFDTATRSPTILDCGAHIGLSLLYFKSRYPAAQIVAFEPNPIIFPLLTRNVEDNDLAGVTLINAAVAAIAGQIDFYVDKRGPGQWTWGGAGVRNQWLRPGNHRTIQVPALSLASFITRDIDLLKLDVEGMEGPVLSSIAPVLHRVKEVVLEFHGSACNPANNLDRILATLARAGFSTTLRQGTGTVTPDQVARTDPFWLVLNARR